MENFKTVDKKTFISELADVFIDSKLFGFDCIGVSHDIHNDTLILDMTYNFEDVSIKLDLSKIGIEFGTHEFPDEDSDGVFTPIRKI